MNKKMKKPKTETRSITKSGGSKVVALPPSFLELNDLEPTDKVVVRYMNDILEIKPLPENGTKVGIKDGDNCEK